MVTGSQIESLKVNYMVPSLEKLIMIKAISYTMKFMSNS